MRVRISTRRRRRSALSAVHPQWGFKEGMLGFTDLQSHITIQYQLFQTDLWTVYHVSEHPFERGPFDWGPAYLYVFPPQGTFSVRNCWLDLQEAVKTSIAANPQLTALITWVPFSYVGTDCLLQAKPPYDGGYSTTHYGEFLSDGSCVPLPDILLSVAQVQAATVTALDWAGRTESSRAGLITRVLHATLIKPYSHLFWDDGTWRLYYPAITRQDVAEWHTLTGCGARSRC